MYDKTKNECDNLTRYSAHLRYARRRHHPLAYVCGDSNNGVAVIDLVTAQTIASIPCGNPADPFDIALSPSQDWGYVIDYNHEKVLTLDLIRGKMINEASVDGTPRGVSVSPCSGFVYIVFEDKPIMQVLQAITLKSLARIPLPAPSRAIAITADGMAYITQPSLNQTAVMDLQSYRIIKLLDTGVYPNRIAIESVPPMALVTDLESGTITPIDTCDMITQKGISLGSDTRPSGLAFIKGGVRCLVALQQENTAAIVDICTRQVAARIPVGELPGGVGTSKIRPLAAVSNQISGTVSIIDTNAMLCTATVDTGGFPRGIAVSE